MLRQSTIFGSWNVQGFLDNGKIQILEHNLKRYRTTTQDLLKPTEREVGILIAHTIYFSGNDNSIFSEFAIIISKSCNWCVLDYNPTNVRIVSIKLCASSTPLHIIQVHAPK